MRRLNPLSGHVPRPSRPVGATAALVAGLGFLLASTALVAFTSQTVNLTARVVQPLGVCREGKDGGKIKSLTLAYRDFGFGTPVAVTLVRDQRQGHFSPGNDNFHGPITVAANGTFTILADARAKRIGSQTRLKLQRGTQSLLIKVHTSCSIPIEIGFLYGADGDDSEEAPSEFAPTGSLSAAVQVIAATVGPKTSPTPAPPSGVDGFDGATPLPADVSPFAPQTDPADALPDTDGYPTATPETPADPGPTSVPPATPSPTGAPPPQAPSAPTPTPTPAPEAEPAPTATPQAAPSPASEPAQGGQ
jgi:hypothetical protein